MKKIVLIGAGSAVFGLGTINDMFKSETLRGTRIVLHDINARALKKIADAAESFRAENGLDYTIEPVLDRREALKDADCCVISIEVGQRFELWDMDWKLPLQFGIKQIYGENGGPGGLFHSLRIIPPILDICQDVMDVCPSAVVFNYSNPMQRICHAVTTKFPELKFIGLCHEIQSLEEHLPVLLETDRSNISYRAGGLNHLSILVDVKYNDTGKDAYPIVHEKFQAYFSGYENIYDDYHHSKPGGERALFFELYNRYGYLPITVDSHLGEYLSWGHSVADHDGINEFYTNYKRKCLSFSENEQDYVGYFDLTKPTRERIVPILEAMVENNGMEEAAVNIPNAGCLANLPDDIVAEVPAIINSRGATGIGIPDYPAGFCSLLSSQVGCIRMTTSAVLNKSRDDALFALLSDPVVDDARAAERLLSTILELQEDYLGYLQ
jgi:alpha-galactosidase